MVSAFVLCIMTLDCLTIHDVLRTVLDPEMPVNIVDLGIVAEVRVEGGERVAVDITPTFVGCPALDVLRDDIVKRLRAAGATDIRVQFVNDPVWSVERITDAGREALRQHGVTVPARGSVCSDSRGANGGAHTDAADGRSQTAATCPTTALVPLTISTEPVACPFCGDRRTHLESRFGPTRCRTIYYCDACKNQFEHMKAI